MNALHDFYLMHRPQSIFFLVFIIACLPVLFYYRRRNPNPRFRPTMGEMAMVSLFAAAFSAGMAMVIGGMFNEHVDLSKMKEKAIQDFGNGGGGAVQRRPRSNSDTEDGGGRKVEEKKILDAIRDSQN